jgi:amino acid adenylation domain-containing protein
LVAALEPVRDPGRHPLFQVALTLQNTPMPAAIFPGLELEIRQLDTGTARFDLTLLLHERDGSLAGALEHSADLFDPATVRRFLGSFVSLLAGIVEDPDLPVSLLPLVSKAERRQILEVWSRPAERPHPSDPSDLAQLFVRQAARTPEAVALVDLGAGGVETTYRELDRRSALLARRLRAAGAAPDVPVAVLLERSADMVVALLGILRAGAAYVPLDLGYPRERLAWMLEDSGARLVVTRGGAVEPLGQGLEAVRIDDLPEFQVGAAVAPPAVSVSPDHLAYVLYTSGSTGRPKGVAVPHRAIARLVIDPGYVELGPEETILQLAPVPFDASTFEIWGALLNGGRLAIFPAGPVSLHELAAALRRYRVTTVFLTAGLFHQMIDEEPEGLSGLRQLVAGGDAISVAHARSALERLPGCRLVNGYGPTETTTFALCHRITPADTVRPRVALGRPIPRTSVWLLDERLEPVPPGVPGEMYLGGDGLARGYWRRPEQTADRFVPHPFAAAPGERLYRTGDLARWLPDGTVDFLGRIDRQVKVRGFRVEPAEIETTLERHPGVLAAVVQPRDDGRGNKRLVAWIVPAAPDLSDGELPAWCREHLPAFMVPGAFVLLDTLPLDPNGKVDRKALPEPEMGSRGGFVAARTPLETQVAAVWSEVLGVDPVGAEDDFFELGGHSLLATRIVARLERELGMELGLRAFFDEPTVAGVALAITREQMRQEEPEQIASLLAQVQDLSPEELERLLREGGV